MATHLYSLALTVVVFQLLSVSLGYDNLSYIMPELANCMPAHCFCEQVNTDFSIRQLSNTLSSLAFIYAGWLIFFRSFFEKDFLMQLFGIINILMGTGSTFFHATLSFLGQVLDLAGMFLLASFILLYALYRVFNLSKGETITLFIVLNIVLDIGLFVAPDMRRYLFAILIILGVGFEFSYIIKQQKYINTKWLKYALATLIIAFGIWILDITKIACDPKSLLQGHALWHILSALSVYFLYLYYFEQKHK